MLLVVSLRESPKFFSFVFAILVVAFFCTLFVYLSFVWIIKPSHGLYSVYALFTSRLTTSTLLGFVFGGLFAIWLRRIYKKKPAGEAAKFSIPEKFEAALLFVLFILGTTSYTVSDLLSGFAGGFTRGEVSASVRCGCCKQLRSGPTGSGCNR